MRKELIYGLALLAIVATMVAVVPKEAKALTPGANIKALVLEYADPATNGNGNITIRISAVFADKASNDVESESAFVSIDPSGTLASMKTAIVNALIAQATFDGYNLVAADIMMPSYIKGN